MYGDLNTGDFVSIVLCDIYEANHYGEHNLHIRVLFGHLLNILPLVQLIVVRIVSALPNLSSYP